MEEKKVLVPIDTVDESLVFSPHAKLGYTYNRTSSIPLSQLQDDIKKLYETKYCFVVPSGMAAISTTLHSILSLNIGKKYNLIYGHQLFSQSPKILELMKEIYGCNLCKIDVNDEKKISELIEVEWCGKNNILFIESCSNPDGYILDYNVIALLRKNSASCYVVMDNTWLSAAVFNPFTGVVPVIMSDTKVNDTFPKVDCVVNSLTKYYSCGTAIGGAILLNDDKLSDSVQRWIKVNGLHVSPHNIELISKNIKTLTKRIEQSSYRTKVVLDRLLTSPIADRIMIKHPFLSSHPSNKLAIKYWKNDLICSVFTFCVPLRMRRVIKMLEKQKDIEYKTSFGGCKSRIDPFHAEFKSFDKSINFCKSLQNVVAVTDSCIKTVKKEDNSTKHKMCRWTKCRISIGSNDPNIGDQLMTFINDCIKESDIVPPKTKKRKRRGISNSIKKFIHKEDKIELKK